MICSADIRSGGRIITVSMSILSCYETDPGFSPVLWCEVVDVIRSARDFCRSYCFSVIIEFVVRHPLLSGRENELPLSHLVS